MKNFDLVDYVHQMGRNNIFCLPPYYKGELLEFSFWWYTFSVPLQVKYFCDKEGAKERSQSLVTLNIAELVNCCQM